MKLAVWFSPDGGTFTRLAPDVEFASVPFAMVAGIAETIKERTVGSTQLAEGAVQSPNIGLGAVGSAQIAIGGVQSANIADGSLTVSDFSSELREASVIPPGTILPFAGPVANVPAGWKVCDGSAVSRTTYATLFAAIGTSWGKGNGSSTFALPNLAGAMLAGTGTGVINGRNKVGPAIGAFQEDSMQGHWHTSVASSSASFGYSAPHIGINFNGTPSGISVRDATSDGSNIPPRTGLETRPYRAGVNYIIKL
ncbi:MAG: tail fiber protein [Verrucomicrobia bacterium]|nr:tail fiber protein [Verrucomicrobiota bacterium]